MSNDSSGLSGFLFFIMFILGVIWALIYTILWIVAVIIANLPWIIICLSIIGVIVTTWRSVGIYNRFYSLKNSSEATLGQIHVAMKKRFDMIEQLHAIVGQYAGYEKDTLIRITRIRASVNEKKPRDLRAIQYESNALLGRLIVTAEAYPALQASTLFASLMNSIETIEDEIAQHRYKYNEISEQYNTMTDTIPERFIGDIAGLKKIDYLEFEDRIASIPTGRLISTGY